MLVNLPFLFLTLDAYNLNGDIYSSSYLALGLNPYHAATNVGQGYLIIPGAGYFILPYNAVAFLAYPAFGFNAIATSALLKSIGLVAGFLAARVAYEIARRESVGSARAIFLAVLFNPFLIFVNSIAGDADLLVVFLVFLAVFLFRYGWKTPVHIPAILLGAVAISLTVLSYYFTLLLIPTLILWIDGRKAKLYAVAVLAATLVVLALPIAVLGLGSTNPSSLTGAVEVTGYSFPYYLPHPATAFFSANQAIFTGLAVVLSILIPVLFRRWNVGEGTSLLTVLVVAFALTFRLPFDVFSILAALVPLSLVLSPSRGSVTYGKCLLLQAFLVPVYILVEMYNGPGQVTGLYYWGYPYLHQNTILYGDLGGARGAEAFFLVYVVSVAITLAVLVWRDRKAPGESVGVGRPERSSGLPPAPVRRWSYIAAGSVAVLLIVLSMAAAIAPASSPSLDYHGQLNSQEFYAYDPSDPSLYPLSSPATFSVDSSRGTLSVADSSPPVGLARSVANTTNRVDFTVTVSPSGDVGPIPVWESNHTEVDYTRTLAIGVGSRPWVPQGSPAPPTIIPGRTPVLNGTSTFYEVKGAQVQVYSESPAALVGHEQFFGAEYTGSAAVENTLWAVTFGPETAARCFLTGSTLYLGVENGTTWTIAGVTTNVAEGHWFLAGFGVDPVHGVVSAFADNANLSLPLALPNSGNYTFLLGKLNLSNSVDGREAWIGNLTDVYSLAPDQVQFAAGFFASTTISLIPVWVAGGDSARIGYSSSPPGGSLTVNGTGLAFFGTDSLVLFGKLAASPASLSFQVEETYFVRATSGLDFGWVVVGIGVLLPLWSFLWCGRELWVSLRGPATR